MKIRITVPLALLSVLLGIMSLRAAEVKTDPEEMSTDELLTILNVHFFKWSYQSDTPYRKLNFRFVYCVRLPSGDFQREVFHEGPDYFNEPRQSNDIIISLDNKGPDDLELGFGIYAGSCLKLKVPSDFTRTGYVTNGSGKGGLPTIIGSEYILLFRNKDARTSFKKADMRDYVSVEIESE